MKQTNEAHEFDSSQREELLQNDGLYTRGDGDSGLITGLICSVAVLKFPVYIRVILPPLKTPAFGGVMKQV